MPQNGIHAIAGIAIHNFRRAVSCIADQRGRGDDTDEKNDRDTLIAGKTGGPQTTRFLLACLLAAVQF